VLLIQSMQHLWYVVNWKDVEGNVCGMICGAIHAFVWRDRGNLQKIYVWINCLRSQILTQAAPIKNQ
jgi:hypothetical protein